jgi:wyosine [tRNA(Phe)-imidazoG37] synthetase (radical SAM superfamily)
MTKARSERAPGAARRRPAQVYGPVPSRRLGLSLGVDLLCDKVCTFDCVYCQLGPTRHRTIRRRPTAPPAVVADEVRRALEDGPTPDVITLAGSGEPTLSLGVGALIAALKKAADVPVALLTNGSLFWDPEVRREAALADLVLPSLDAGDEDLFRRVNRPHNALSLAKVVSGLEAFRAEYAGPIWLEVMVVGGATDRPSRLEAIAGLARRLRPDRIQLNTPERPSRLGPRAIVPKSRLEALCGLFTPGAEVVAGNGPKRPSRAEEAEALRRRLLDLLARRPCTSREASEGLLVRRGEVSKILGALAREGLVDTRRRGSRLYYVAGGRSEGP